jgi:membrane-bound serine protease (ClpP class)
MLLVIILFLVAVAFILAELFLPGGVFGVMGVLAIIGSMVIAFQQYREAGFWIVVVELLVAASVVLAGLRFFPATSAGKRFILGRNLDKRFGYSGTEPLDGYVGKEGASLTHLRPAGIALIGGTRVDVVSEGTFIEKGRRVKVVEVEGNRVVVRELDHSSPGKEG